jgi:hypothetical protein
MILMRQDLIYDLCCQYLQKQKQRKTENLYIYIHTSKGSLSLIMQIKLKLKATLAVHDLEPAHTHTLTQYTRKVYQYQKTKSHHGTTLRNCKHRTPHPHEKNIKH